jgi:polar amino acid transport system substrate-binding protein
MVSSWTGQGRLSYYEPMMRPLVALLLALPLVASDLAPTGTLRAVFLGDNPVQGKVDKSTGAVTGPVADLVKELARRLNVSFTLIPAPNARGVIDTLTAHKADIGFLAYEAGRAAEVDFSKPYALMHSSFLLPADSKIRTSADADRAGVKVGAVRGQSQEIYLSQNIKNARVRVFQSTPPDAEIEKLLLNGEIDAFGANRQRMVEAAARSPKLRVLPDNFMSVGQAIVVEKGDPSKLEQLNRFLDELRLSGFVKASLDRAQLAGVDVAP